MITWLYVVLFALLRILDLPRIVKSEEEDLRFLSDDEVAAIEAANEKVILVTIDWLGIEYHGCRRYARF